MGKKELIMEPVIGIDLGTTNSEVGFIIDGKAEILKENDNGIVPSCVGINSAGKVIVGEIARNQAVIYPESTVVSVKRLMGSDETIQLKDKSYTPQEISAFILIELKERAERIIGKKISKAVITTPAYFTNTQRQATREAGEIAGLDVIRIINEPTAAALAYESKSPMASIIMVYDLGGGTFDVSIVKIEDGVVEVLASTGNNHLGGDDFDREIEKLLIKHIEDEFDINVNDDIAVIARLKRAAENAKIELSDAPFTNIEEDHLCKCKDGSTNVHLSYELSRIKFEELIEDYFQQTMESVNKALSDASILPSAIDKIILVGGSTKIPKLSRMLEEKFNILPHQEIDPDLCVAMGAAIQAGREMGFDSSGVLLDITPYTFGISALGVLDGEVSPYFYVPLIRRNTKLPAIKSEAFNTISDYQEKVIIKIYQGEEPNALDNIKIGEYVFNLSKLPEGSIIIMQFELDLNGILRIKALEKDTGKTITGVIENAFSKTSQKSITNSKNKIDELWTDKKEENSADDNGGDGITADKNDSADSSIPPA
ncbi:MAG: Hsp70 family protein, partial [Nitrospiraceae bacterium]|nr:Hsp70 family protein [Nitrospiraceae bacterium]